MSDTPNLEKVIVDLSHAVERLEISVGSIQSDITSMKSEMHTGFRRLEELVLDTRDEMRAESTANRTLINQAFTHISDQLAREGDMNFVPKYPRAK